MKIEDEIKSSFRNDYHKAMVNMYFTNNVIVEQFIIMLKEYGLTAQQFNILRILNGQNPKAVSIGIIKERMLDKNSDVSRIVDRLYKKGLVERKESLSDRRQKDILISNNGIDMIGKMTVCEKKQDEILSNLNKEEVKLLNELLDKIRRK